MRKNSGITAFELAVTIAIMSVIASITLPPYLKWWRASQMQSAVSNLTADLEMARTRAIRENAFVAITFTNSGYIIFVDNDKNWIQGDGEDVLMDRILAAGVFIDTAPPFIDKLRFDSRGIPSEIASEEKIAVTQDNTDRQITINRLGHINVQ